MPATTPVLAAEAGASLAGRTIGADEIDEAAELVQGAIDPGGSVHASKEFQRHLAGVLTRRALTKANERARARHDVTETHDIAVTVNGTAYQRTGRSRGCC